MSSAVPPAVPSQLPHLQDLNPQQLEAVTYGLGPLLVFAGAGSGKTRVLTRRIAHMVHERLAAPTEILAVTFTNKAAREMKGRVEQLFAHRRELHWSRLWVSTFHSSCARILRSHAKALDYSPNFAIYDTSDSNSALKRVYKRLNIDPKLIEPRMVMSRIDRAKNDYRFPEDLRRDQMSGMHLCEYVADLYEGYQQELRNSNAMDFGDLLCNVVTLFRLEPSILKSFQDRFRFLLVDEYQDTNKVQYLLIKLLTQTHQNITVVGDDDQSIYGFRGANISNILNFNKDFPDAHRVTLHINYRSTKNILMAANAVIAVNTKRQKKTMDTPNPPGDPLNGFKAFDERDEAEFVAREISSLLAAGHQPSEIAIFYRTNAQSRAIEEALIENAIPYQIFGGHRFYERKEIKDILAYYRLLLNPHDNESLLRIVNVPTRGLGATTVGHILAFAQKRSVSLSTAIEQIVSGDPAPGLTAAAKEKLSSFMNMLSSLRTHVESTAAVLADTSGNIPANEAALSLANLLRHIAEGTGYLQALRAQDSLEAEARIENIDELCRVAVDFAERSFEQEAHPTLSEFLDRTALSSDLEEENSALSNQEEDPRARIGHVSLMTLHLAKGLEFDVVFLVGLEEGLLPHVRSIDQPDELEEERRLCYVGLTRARNKLYLSRATDRQSFGRNNWYGGIPSRFIDDLPDDLFNQRHLGFLRT